jgi:multidrug efflux pump subunit AcrA (membrane-fusion protein)
MDGNPNEPRSLPLFRKEALVFQASRLEGDVMVGIRSPWRILGLVSSALLVVVFAVVCSTPFARKAEVHGSTVRTFGYVVMSADAPLVVDQVFVQPGDTVRAGQKLAALRKSQDPANLQPDGGGERVFLASPRSDLVVAAVHVSPGQFAYTEERLIELMPPTGEVAADAMLAPRDFGAVRPGQEVLMSFEAYPKEKFGVARGVVKTISMVPVVIRQSVGTAEPVAQNAYVARISLDTDSIQAFAGNNPLQPGMTFQGKIILGETSFIDWVLGFREKN